MTDITIETSENTSALPLRVEKQPTFKIAGLFVLLVIIGLGNYLFFHNDKPLEEKKANDQYETTYINPLTQPTVANTPDVKNETELAKSHIEQALAEAKAKDFIQRLQASQSASDGTGLESNNIMNHAPQMSTRPSDNNAAGLVRLSDPNTAFLVQESNSKAEHVYATHYGAQPFMIGQGKFIFGTLAGALNSDLPGQVSTIVSQDVYGEQGRHILIPKGSKLIGEYKSGLVNNQSRLFVIWTRVREPNGIDVMLGSEGTDELGRAGLTGETDYHFFARFGTATLMAMISAGASTIGVNPNDEYNSMASYRQNVSQALAQQANNTLNQGINIPPTINIHQGQKIVIFVNRDLDFSRVYR